MYTQPPIAITLEQIRLGQYNSREFAPALWQVPPEFTRSDNAWAQVASELMWAGSSSILKAETRPGIDRNAALMHIGAVLHAIDMSVDHREAAAAYLLSSWFDCVIAGDNVGAGNGVAKNGNQTLLMSA